jgi:integration host factor subunit beta
MGLRVVAGLYWSTDENGAIRLEKKRIAFTSIQPNALLDKPFDSIQSSAYTVPDNLRRISSEDKLMATITKKDLVDKVAEKTKSWQATVKTII